MAKMGFRVLLVEDDPTLGAAIDQALKRSGIDCCWVNNPAAALSTVAREHFDCAVIDCLLPQMNGIELAEQLQRENDNSLKIIITTGVFKDRQFEKDSLRRTRAVQFFSKPFEMTEFIKTITNLAAEKGSARGGPLALFLTGQGQQITSDDLKSWNSIHGFDLPTIYFIAQSLHLSGRLIIEHPNLGAVTVEILKGIVQNIQMKDSQSYFGVLLIEKGFAFMEELEEGLALNSQKKIGERLVDLSHISPHAIKIVHIEQLAIRLSKTITNLPLQMKWEPATIEPSEFALDSHQLTTLLGDWLISKLTFDWLKNFYATKYDRSVHKGINFDLWSQFSGFPLLHPLPDLPLLAEKRKTLQEIIETSNSSEEEMLRAVHFLFLHQVLHLDHSGDSSRNNFEVQIKKFKKMDQAWTGKNYFEILGLNPHSTPVEVQNSYRELAKSLHPDRFPSSAPPELLSLSQKLFARASESHSVLSDPKGLKKYLMELEKGATEESLAAESQFESGVNSLKHGNYKQATRIFVELAKLKTRRSDLYIYLVWAQIKKGVPTSKKAVFISRVEELMDRIPPEERHSPKYFFVKGLYYKLTDDRVKAYKYLKQARNLDPNFIEAKREAQLLKHQLKDENKTLWGTVVTKLIRKAR